MYYLMPTNTTFVVYYEKNFVPESLVNQVLEVETLPEGEGILKRNANGDFYREAVESKEVTPAPTIEDRLETIEQTSAYTQIQVEYLATLAEINNGL